MAKEITFEEFEKLDNAGELTTKPTKHKPLQLPDGTTDYTYPKNMKDYFIGDDQVFIIV